ncbi:MAG: M1 family metallopeptidase, partial [Rhizomicrobium sp.]
AKGMGPKLQYALSLTPAVVTALENYYQLPYPFQKLDILAVPDFAAGAMENAGAVTFREQLLLMDADAPLDQKLTSLDVQAHELAHQWFGDYVTPAWWDDIWLNESFATWMSGKISNIVRPDGEFGREGLRNGLNVMRLDELPSARQIHNPVRTADDMNNAFGDITYSKGDAVLSMFESYVGPEAWQKGIHAYLAKFAYKNATAQDFIGTIASETGHPEIVDAFNDFIGQPGVPVLTGALSCGPAGAALDVTQAPYAAVGIAPLEHSWKVPMCLAADGARTCQLVTPPSTQIAIGSKCPVSLFPNAEGAGYYRFAEDAKGWAALIKSAPALDAAGQLTLVYDLNAEMRAGHASAADYFSLIHALAPVGQWDQLMTDQSKSFSTADSLHEMRVTGVIAPASLAAYRGFIRRNYGPVLARLGLAAKPDEPVADALARGYLVRLLVEEGRDPALIAQLSKDAQTYLASGGKDEGGLPPELREEALRAGVYAQGAPFADRLLESLKTSGDEYYAKTVIYAVAGADDDASLGRLLALALTDTIRIGDLRYVVRDLQRESEGRKVLWAWFKANFDAIKGRVSDQGMAFAPGIFTYACDAAAKQEMDGYFAPKVGALEGLAQNLKQNDDRIDRCMAFKASKGAEINAALKAAK